MIDTGDGAQLCVEAIGDRTHPAILLIAGAASSMDSWDDELCRLLAESGRLVVRYDHRDTGRSTSYPAGMPTYTGADLGCDAVAVLDALGIERAHVAGLSMGGGIAQQLGLDHRDRVATLTLMSTSSIAPIETDLPAMTPQLQAAFADPVPEPDWGDRDAVIAYLVDSERPLAGHGAFDEQRARSTAARAVDRSNDIAASVTNHWLIAGDDEPGAQDLAELRGVPTLVLHGTCDPLFPPAHGRALADQIPGAWIIEFDGVGHQPPPPHIWDLLVTTLVEHTGRDSARSAA